VSIIRSSSRSLRVGARLKIVRATVVVRTPSWTVTSRALSVLERWIVIPVTRRSSTVVTSNGKRQSVTSPHNEAAERLLSTARGPAASSAPWARSTGNTGRCPTAYTRRYSQISQPRWTREAICRELMPSASSCARV
jgi:hypothetical protein